MTKWHILGAEPVYANNIGAIFVQFSAESSGILSFAELLCPMEQKSSNEVFGIVWGCCGQV